MMNEEELLEEVSGFLHGYLKSGKVTINSFISKINTNISNLEQLLTIRFLLKEETMTFVRELPELLKRFKTTTVMHNEINRGEVRGEIDWQETIKERLAENYGDPTIFSTNESIRTYETPENLVLKELLKLLYTVLYNDEFIKGFEKAPWFKEWKQLKVHVEQAYKKNIYLQRVTHKQQVATRTIVKTKSHRNKLYRNASGLLLDYRKMINGQYTEEDIKTLLKNTFIAPENKNVLFELYWIVQLIKENTETSKLHLLDRSQHKVASWSDDISEYHLYHDSSGSGEIKFSVDADEIAESNNLYLNQKYRSFTEARKLARNIFQVNSTNSIWAGRPDFLLEIYEKDTYNLTSLVIGEVKNTKEVNYAVTGMRELIDYIHLAKDRKGNYVNHSEIPIRGILCVGNVPVDVGGSTTQIKIVRSGYPEGLKIQDDNQ